MPTSQQKDPDVARLGQELSRDIRKLGERATTLESRAGVIESYLAVDLVPYLAELAVFVGFGAPPTPPWA